MQLETWTLPGCEVWGPHSRAPSWPRIGDYKSTSEKSVVPQPGSPLKSMRSFKIPGLHSWKFLNSIPGNSNSRGLRQGPGIYIFPKLPGKSASWAMSGNHWTRHHLGQLSPGPACTSGRKDPTAPALWIKRPLSAERETPWGNSMKFHAR